MNDENTKIYHSKNEVDIYLNNINCFYNIWSSECIKHVDNVKNYNYIQIYIIRLNNSTTMLDL